MWWYMLNVVAAMFVVFGLIGLFALVLRYLHQSGKFSNTPFFNTKQQGVIVEPPIVIDSKRRIVNITYRGQRYVVLLGPNNDLLLETLPAIRSIEAADLDRQHV
jgi:flagellar biogenesis protein FliO